MPLRTRSLTSALALIVVVGVGWPSAEAGKIYWTEFQGSPNWEAIMRAELDGSNVETLVSGFPVGPIAVAGGKLYFGVGAGSIHVSDSDGSNIEFLVANAFAQDLAVEGTAGKLYWVAGHRVHRANLDGSDVELILEDDSFSELQGIALDIVNGRMYFTDGFDGVFRANLDGSGVEHLLSSSDFPSDIALDVKNDRMYWTTVDGFLASARLDGSDGESLPISYAVGLAIDLGARQLYFSSQFYEDLRRTNLDYPSGGDRLVSGVRVFRFALEVCGSGLVDPGEECDAGGASAECDGDCTAVQCGDGVVNSAAGEQCDDGNDVGGDGCAPDCSLAAVPAASVRGSVAAMLLLLLATAWRSRPSARRP